MRLLILPLVTLLVAGCAGHPPEVKSFVGAVPESGHGGTVKTVDGVQFWDNGSPKKNFVQVGVIDEDFEWEPRPNELKLWAQAVKAIGGDAVIWPSRDSRELTAKVVKIL